MPLMRMHRTKSWCEMLAGWLAVTAELSARGMAHCAVFVLMSVETRTRLILAMMKKKVIVAIAVMPSKSLNPRVQSAYIIECRASIFGITLMIWGSIRHNST